MPSVLWCCWLGDRKGIRPVKKLEWWGTGMVICLERDADLHMAQLMPLPLTVSCFSKIQIGFTFLVLAHPGSPEKGSLNGGVCWGVVASVSAPTSRDARPPIIYGTSSISALVSHLPARPHRGDKFSHNLGTWRTCTYVMNTSTLLMLHKHSYCACFSYSAINSNILTTSIS